MAQNQTRHRVANQNLRKEIMISDNLKTIFLDAGGVLFFEKSDCQNRIRNLLKAQGISDSLIERGLEKGSDVINNYIGKGIWPINWAEEERFWKLFYKAVTSELHSKNLFLEHELFHLTHFVYHHELFPEVKSVLDSLIGKYSLGVISNALPSLEWIFDLLDIRRYFKTIIISSVIGFRKPGGEIYIHALKKMEVEPENCLFIDDKYENIITAEKLGIKSFHLNREKNDLRDFLFKG
jgi:putative hydrolase of the HAD superfamily